MAGAVQKQGIYNTIITYVGIFIGFLNNLIIMPYVLPKEELGLTRVMYSIAALFATLFPVGMAAASIKFFPRFRDRDSGHHGFLRLLITIALIFFVIFTAAALLCRHYIFSWYEGSPMLLEYFSLVLPMSFCIGFVQLLNVYCFSLFRSTFPLLINEVFIRVWMMAILSLYFLHLLSFDAFVWLYVGSFGVQLLILFSFIAKVDTGLFHPIDRDFLRKQKRREMLGFLVIVAPAALASAALKLIDASMVGSDLNKGNALADAAIYGIAVTIASIIEAPSNALIRIADTKISDAINRNDMDYINTIYRKSTRALMIIGGLLFVGVVINIRVGLELIPGNFASGYLVVIIIGAGAFVNMATGVNSSLVFYSPKYKQGTLLLLGLILLTVTLNYFLIPVYGIEGAAIGTASSAVLYNIFKAIIIYRHFRIQPYERYAVFVLLLMGAALGVNYFLPRLGNAYLDILYRSVVVTAIYGGGVLLLRLFPEANGFIKKYTGISL